MRFIVFALLAAAAPEQELWYRASAAEWAEALPVGSGRLGAMVLGGVEHEGIQFTARKEIQF